MRRRLVAVGVLVLLLAAVAVGGLMSGGSGTTRHRACPRDGGACARHSRRSSPRTRPSRPGQRPGGRPRCGRRVPEARRRRATRCRPRRCSRRSPTGRRSRGAPRAARATGSRSGRRDAQGLDNEYRDRSVYNAGTPDFSGRIAHVAIDPNCRANGQCTLWIANANGGVWRTNNALDASPKWQYVSNGFEHNNTASIELDPNDKQGRTLYVGTGEPNACGSGCEAGVGIYYSKNAGNTWVGPLGRDELQQPGRRLDRGQARRLEDDLRRLGPRGPRRLERLLRRRGRAHPGCPALRALPLDERR